jgi:hypothetical protein
MNKEEFAKMINGREQDALLSADDCLIANENNLVVVFAYSDDLLELEGAIIDELGCYNGGTFFFEKDFERWVDIDDSFEGVDLEDLPVIYAVCNDHSKYNGFWYIDTNLEYARFETMKNGEPFCSGLVFNYTDLYKESE